MTVNVEKLRSKDLVVMVTGAGGILLAGLLAYILFKISANHLVHLTAAVDQNTASVTAAIDRQSQVQQKQTEVLSGLSNNVQLNTKAIEYLLKR